MNPLLITFPSPRVLPGLSLIEELIKFMIEELSGILVCMFKVSKISYVKFGKLGITFKLSLKEIKSLGFDTSVITLLINLSISDTFFKQSDIWVRSI